MEGKATCWPQQKTNLFLMRFKVRHKPLKVPFLRDFDLLRASSDPNMRSGACLAHDAAESGRVRFCQLSVRDEVEKVRRESLDVLVDELSRRREVL